MVRVMGAVARAAERIAALAEQLKQLVSSMLSVSFLAYRAGQFELGFIYLLNLEGLTGKTSDDVKLLNHDGPWVTRSHFRSSSRNPASASMSVTSHGS